MLEVIHLAGAKAEIGLSGNWTLSGEAVAWQTLLEQLTQGPEPLAEIGFCSEAVTDWDSRLLTFLLKLHAYASSKTFGS